MTKNKDIQKILKTYREELINKLINKIIEIKLAYPQINSKMTIKEITKLINKN